MLNMSLTLFSDTKLYLYAEIMSVLYNFVKVDTPTFLSNPHNLEVVISMCKVVMSGDPGEDPQVHACKLLEVVVLQCRGKIDMVSLDYVKNLKG